MMSFPDIVFSFYHPIILFPEKFVFKYITLTKKKSNSVEELDSFI